MSLYRYSWETKVYNFQDAKNIIRIKMSTKKKKP